VSAEIAEPLAGIDQLSTALDEPPHVLLRAARAGAEHARWLGRRRGWLVRRVLLLADVLGLLGATGVAFVAGGGLHNASAADVGIRFGVILLTVPFWVVLAKLYGLYDRDEERTDHSTIHEIVAVTHFVTLGTWVLFLIGWASDIWTARPSQAVTFWLSGIALIACARALARIYCHRQVAYLQNTIIVGAGDVGQLVARKLLGHQEYGINLVGFVDDNPRERRDDLGHLTLLGSSAELPELVELFDVERVIIAFSNDRHDETLTLIRSIKDYDVQVDIVPRLFEILGTKVSMHTVEGVPLIGLPPIRLARSSRLLKRTTDLVLAAAGLTILSPLLIAVAILIKLDSAGPVFFRQVRMGEGEQTFRIFKFRTMVVDADDRKAQVAHLNMHARNGGDPRMFKVPNDPRITRIGGFLRRTSIDELPQLLNVLHGEMSLVGPRPLILEEDRCVLEWARKRLNLKPGITGLWQVLGRSDIPFDEMTRLDYLYVTNWSLAEDLKLIFLTFPSLFRRRAAY
jgi:exopolysaccharide biosynthesis polyprenyl glycosylphosphotransferase